MVLKIRGFDVDPVEIEAALLEHPAIQEAIVVGLGDEDEMRLVAYLVAIDAELPGHAELYAHAHKRLRNYMVPSTFVRLEHLPRTADGETDHAALPRVEAAHEDNETAYVAPQNAAEAALCEIWASVLGLERVGSDANLCELGGDSTMAVQAMLRIRSRLGCDVELQDIFDATVAEIAAGLRLGVPEMGTDDRWT